MLQHQISLPLWALLLLLAFAGWAVLDRLLVPSVRWFIRRRVSQVLEEVRHHLHIEIEPFRLTKREVLIDRLMYDPEVMAAAEAHARDEDMPREVVMETVGRYAREIVPAFNAYFYFRIGTWLARRVAQLLYRVRLGVVDEEGLATIAPRSTVVFVMNHRSNMDFVLVGYLAASRTALSYAVGEWARIWPLQSLIKSMGGYFVRRSSRNPLYRKVLARYIHMATAGGVTQAMFPEGGLSRDGALRPPKMGLIDYMLRGFDPDGERDLVFVPVAVNYDRVLEDRTLLLDLEEEPPLPSAWRSAAVTTGFVVRNLGQMLIGRWHRFGYALVNIGSPISMRDWCRDLDLRPDEMEDPVRFELVGRVADRLMGAVSAILPVVPVAVVAEVLRSAGRSLTELELKAGAHDLVADLEHRGVAIHVPRRDREYAIAVGLRMLTLRRIVIVRDGLLEIAEGEEKTLAYYANSIAHHLTEAASGSTSRALSA